MVESLERLGDVARHRKVDCAVGIVPTEADTQVQGARPIGGDGILLFQNGG